MTPTDLVVDAESLKAKLKTLPLTGSQLILHSMERDRLRHELETFLKQRKPSAADRELFQEAHGILEEIDALIHEYQNAETVEAEAVLEEYEAAGASLKKPKQESSRINQDAMLLDTATDVFGVFDGLGGAPNGDKASRSAAASVQQFFARLPATKDFEVMKRWMAESLKEASRKIHAESMGDRRETTASVVKLWDGPDGKRKAIIGNAGDSRVYIYRAKTGKLEQLTLDDSMMLPTSAPGANYLPKFFAETVNGKPNELYKDFTRFLRRTRLSEKEVFAAAPKSRAEAKALQQEVNNADTEKDFEALSPYAKFYFEFNHILSQSLGGDYDVMPQINVTDVEEGDLVIVTSDGVHDNLSDQRIREIVASGASPDAIAHKLANEAQAASAEFQTRSKPDDITSVVIAIPKREKKAAGQAA